MCVVGGNDALEWRITVSPQVEIPKYEMRGTVQVDPARTALIVVDMQNDFVKENGSLLVPDAEGTIPRIRELIARARDAGMHVVFTQDTHREGDPEWEIWPEHAREGTWGWQIVDELQPREGETVIRKLRYDGFYGTPLDHLLRLWDIGTVIVCGTVANICVHYTAASAALRWYHVIIPRDATSSLDRFDMELSLRQTTFLFGGDITTVDGIKV
jgi:nicotinamidase-related amidase